MEWETVIGLEVHVELSTRTKMFCGCPVTFGAEPNTQCCPVCMGLPGALPVVNKTAVELAARACLALNCTLAEQTAFDRKNYFYPDLPKAYQISQLYHPLGRDGWLEIGEGANRIRIHEIHMEEDAGRLSHPAGEAYTKIDFNRCGIPLIEIVSEPELRDGKEAALFLSELQAVLRASEVSDCRMQEGSMRADVNLSVRPAGSRTLGTRTEMKNLSSFRAVAAAAEYEANRQIAALERGERITQETRRWDEARRVSEPMRKKEEAQDYRYFPDPDLRPILIEKEWAEKLRDALPELPRARRIRYQAEYSLGREEAALLSAENETAAFFEETVRLCGRPREAANWITGELFRLLKEGGRSLSQSAVRPGHLADVIAMLDGGSINRAAAKEALEAAFCTGAEVRRYVREKGLEQVCGEAQILAAVQKALKENEKAVRDFRGGKAQSFGFLMGQCMKQLKGKGDPKAVNTLLRAALENKKNN